MPRPNGPQWRDAFGDEPVRANAISIVNKAEGELTPEQTKQVYRATNIRHWPIDESTWDNYAIGHRGGFFGVLDRTHPLNTDQSTLHAPSLRKYMAANPSDAEPDDFNPDDYKFLGDYDEGDVYYPEVASSFSNRSDWIQDGHHRITASRLMNKPSAWVSFINMARYMGYR